MKLKLKNIGTLKQAEIDLSKDLIVLAGPNNTGKTYAAYTVYGFFDTLKENRRAILDIFTRIDIDNTITQLLSATSKNNPFECKINVDTLVDKILDIIWEHIKIIFPAQLSHIFAADQANFEKSQLEISVDKKELNDFIKGKKIFFQEDTYFSFPFKNNINISKKENDDFIYISVLTDGSTDDFLHGSFLENLGMRITGLLIEHILDFYIKTIYINTAERSAINIFSKELSIKRNTIIDKLLEVRDTKNGSINQLMGKLQRYPLPIRDSLAIAEDLANLSRNKSEYGFLADRIEEVLLDGRITTSKEGEVQYSPNKSKVKNLSIHLTASIVKSLSNLVFYFRHLAQKGDFIIIDEPELNLHPDNQRKVARLIGEIIGHGFKVMISTHSDYIIREINNLIMLKSGGEKAENLIAKYGYKKEQLVDYKRVGSSLFKNNRNYNIEVSETGFEVNTIDEEINNLNNASEEIFFTLFD
ncbi:AAA family ATPase [Cellulophaga sp. BC115SP]|uniref:AAA family ATPase n=1 Tax=Cellulophaga sp. BC115SP TaxID=2683263 RepID=UPI001412C49C|nr:AAA family ATPase [Cellulophaga sp. BC115SP]NBB29120.1 AAA family ATPase [Cellulophaga sp. BC115SP]